MKQFEKWRSLYIASIILSICFVIYAITRTEYWFTLIGVLLIILFSLAFIGLWRSLRIHGVKTEVDISRVLGKDAKDALSFGHIGILTYDNEYVVTWASPYFKENNIDIVNHKLTSWIENIRTIFDEDVDVVIGKYEDKIYEITRKSDAQILYVADRQTPGNCRLFGRCHTAEKAGTTIYSGTKEPSAWTTCRRRRP